MNRVDLSICIPAYQMGRYIGQTVMSCLRQSEVPFEILVSDNHSTDETPSVLRNFADSIRVISPERHLPIAAHYSFVISQARGTHVVLLGADDMLAPSFVATVRKRVGSSAMLATGRIECDGSMSPERYAGISYFIHPTLPPPDGFGRFLRGCAYSVSGTVFEREWLASLPPLPVDAGLGFDWYFALCAGATREIRFDPRPLHFYRIHDTNNSHSAPSRWRSSARAMLEFAAQQSVFSKDQQARLRDRARRIPTEGGSAKSSRSRPGALAASLARALTAGQLREEARNGGFSCG